LSQKLDFLGTYKNNLPHFEISVKLEYFATNINLFEEKKFVGLI
jgi:hypothetical protein